VSCRKRGGHLVHLNDAVNEAFILNTVLEGAPMSFWTGLNFMDNPSAGVTGAQWYLSGQGYVPDAGWRGSVNTLSVSGDGSSSQVTSYVDGFCVSWRFSGGQSQGLSVSPCSNEPQVVDGYICQWDILPWIPLV